MRRMLILAGTATLLLHSAAAAPPPDTPAGPEGQQQPDKPPTKPIPVEPGQRHDEEALSDKLDRSEGVLHPGPTPDPAVKVPPLRQGNERDVVVPPTERSPAVEPKF
jgi:hypothetical protein